jgi:hypothetical protein
VRDPLVQAVFDAGAQIRSRSVMSFPACSEVPPGQLRMCTLVCPVGGDPIEVAPLCSTGCDHFRTAVTELMEEVGQRG